MLDFCYAMAFKVRARSSFPDQFRGQDTSELLCEYYFHDSPSIIRMVYTVTIFILENFRYLFFQLVLSFSLTVSFYLRVHTINSFYSSSIQH